MRVNKGSAADCQELMRNARRPFKVAQNVAQVRPGITAERIGIEDIAGFALTRPGNSRPKDHVKLSSRQEHGASTATSSSVIARFLREVPRDRIILATKFGFRIDPDEQFAGVDLG